MTDSQTTTFEFLRTTKWSKIRLGQTLFVVAFSSLKMTFLNRSKQHRSL